MRYLCRNCGYRLSKISIIMLLMVGISIAAYAQTTVSGRVVDQEDRPVSGVSISVKGSSKTVSTDEDGRFSLEAIAPESVLAVSHLGYKSQEIPVRNRQNVLVILVEGSEHLDEVVVIGYGEVSRGDLTGSVGEVKMDDMLRAPVASIDQALAGRVAGVQVSASDGQPGSEMNIVIRGGNSLTQDNSPLYVIDGFPIENPSLAAINPEDVASITVLKDASATAIYGSRGANGVVVIETKGGQEGKMVTRYEGAMGMQQVTKTMEMMDGYEFVRYQIERNPEDHGKRYLTDPGRTLEDYKNLPTFNWQDQLFRTANTQSHNLSLSGGNAATKFLISGSLYDFEGVILNSGYNRKQGRVRLDHDVSKKLKLQLSGDYSSDMNYGQLASAGHIDHMAHSTSTLYQTWGYRPVAIGDDFSELEDELIDEFANDNRVNPILAVKNEVRRRLSNTLNIRASAIYDINKEFSFTTRGGIRERNIRDEGFFNSKTARGFPRLNNPRGVNGSIYNDEYTDWMNENLLRYRKRINRQHSLDGLIGFTLQGRKRFRDGYESHMIPIESLGLSGIDNGTPVNIRSEVAENTLVSYLSRVNYNYKGKYLLTATFRADGSSKFSKENRWAYFPSAAFAWRMSRESFMKKIKVIDDAKFRVSWGQTGNNRIGDFQRLPSLDLSYGYYYSFDNGTPSPSFVFNRMANDGLKWETTTQLDAGFDIFLFKNRINLVLDVYQKTTEDLLLNANVPTSSGFNTVLQNIGSIRNRGLEITLNTVNIKAKDFQWSSDFNISFNDNKVLSLTEGETSFLSRVSWTGSYNTSSLYMTRVGYPATAFYGVAWDGVYQYSDFDDAGNLKPEVPSNGMERDQIQPGDIKYKDINGDGIVNEMDNIIIGRAIPIHVGGLNNNFSYKGFSLNVFFQWSYGNSIFNANRLVFEGNTMSRHGLNQYAVYANRWTPENQSNQYFRTNGQGPSGIYSSWTIEDGSFLRLKTASLEYTLPNKLVQRVKMNRVSVYMAAQNLYTWTKYSGMDPEVSVKNSTLTPGFDYSAYPMARTITLGLRATL